VVVEQRTEEINRDAGEQAHRLLLDVIECRFPEAAILDAARFHRVARLRLWQSRIWRDKARPGDDVRVFDWAAGREGGSR